MHRPSFDPPLLPRPMFCNHQKRHMGGSAWGSPFVKGHLPRSLLHRVEQSLDEDPWKLSAFVSAILYLIFSVLLFLSAVVTGITTQIVRLVQFEPRCPHSENGRGIRHPPSTASRPRARVGLGGGGGGGDPLNHCRHMADILTDTNSLPESQKSGHSYRENFGGRACRSRAIAEHLDDFYMVCPDCYAKIDGTSCVRGGSKHTASALQAQDHHNHHRYELHEEETAKKESDERSRRMREGVWGSGEETTSQLWAQREAEMAAAVQNAERPRKAQDSSSKELPRTISRSSDLGGASRGSDLTRAFDPSGLVRGMDIGGVCRGFDVSGVSNGLTLGGASRGFDLSGVSSGLTLGGVSSGLNLGVVSSGLNLGVGSGLNPGGVSNGLNPGGVSSDLNLGGVSRGLDLSGVSSGLDLGGVCVEGGTRVSEEWGLKDVSGREGSLERPLLKETSEDSEASGTVPPPMDISVACKGSELSEIKAWLAMEQPAMDLGYVLSVGSIDICLPAPNMLGDDGSLDHSSEENNAEDNNNTLENHDGKEGTPAEREKEVFTRDFVDSVTFDAFGSLENSDRKKNCIGGDNGQAVMETVGEELKIPLAPFNPFISGSMIDLRDEEMDGREIKGWGESEVIPANGNGKSFGNVARSVHDDWGEWQQAREEEEEDSRSIGFLTRRDELESIAAGKEADETMVDDCFWFGPLQRTEDGAADMKFQEKSKLLLIERFPAEVYFGEFLVLVTEETARIQPNETDSETFELGQGSQSQCESCNEREMAATISNRCETRRIATEFIAAITANQESSEELDSAGEVIDAIIQGEEEDEDEEEEEEDEGRVSIRELQERAEEITVGIGVVVDVDEDDVLSADVDDEQNLKGEVLSPLAQPDSSSSSWKREEEDAVASSGAVNGFLPDMIDFSSQGLLSAVEVLRESSDIHSWDLPLGETNDNDDDVLKGSIEGIAEPKNSPRHIPFAGILKTPPLINLASSSELTARDFSQKNIDEAKDGLLFLDNKDEQNTANNDPPPPVVAKPESEGGSNLETSQELSKCKEAVEVISVEESNPHLSERIKGAVMTEEVSVNENVGIKDEVKFSVQESSVEGGHVNISIGSSNQENVESGIENSGDFVALGVKREDELRNLNRVEAFDNIIASAQVIETSNEQMAQIEIEAETSDKTSKEEVREVEKVDVKENPLG